MTFDAQAATAAYIDSLGPEALAKAARGGRDRRPRRLCLQEHRGPGRPLIRIINRD